MLFGQAVCAARAHCLPMRILIALRRIVILDAAQPKVEPVEVALVDRQPMRWLPFDMMLAGENAHFHRPVAFIECRIGFEC